jgi:hypothetical protein
MVALLGAISALVIGRFVALETVMIRDVLGAAQIYGLRELGWHLSGALAHWCGLRTLVQAMRTRGARLTGGREDILS